LPLRIFEPRYLSLIDHALKKGHRMIGLVQPNGKTDKVLHDTGCIGRITQFAEIGDDQYYITLNGLCRFTILHELEVKTAFRQAEIDPFEEDFIEGVGEKEVNREELIKTLKIFLKNNNMDADWEDIKKTSTEMLVNALSVMSPWGLREKQALLESANLKTRADLLIALSEKSIALNKTTKTAAPQMLQ
jgi:Lon protease-like protein